MNGIELSVYFEEWFKNKCLPPPSPFLMIDLKTYCSMHEGERGSKVTLSVSKGTVLLLPAAMKRFVLTRWAHFELVGFLSGYSFLILGILSSSLM